MLHPVPRSIVTSFSSTAEARSRGYVFDRSKLGRIGSEQRILVTDEQLQYEWRWLLSKLRRRSPSLYRRHLKVVTPAAHSLFCVMPGPIADWEHVRRLPANPAVNTDAPRRGFARAAIAGCLSR